MLEFFKSDSPQVVAENIPKCSFLLGNIKQNDPPQPIPRFLLFDAKRITKELQKTSAHTSILGKFQSDRSIFEPNFFKESLLM